MHRDYSLLGSIKTENAKNKLHSVLTWELTTNVYKNQTINSNFGYQSRALNICLLIIQYAGCLLKCFILDFMLHKTMVCFSLHKHKIPLLYHWHFSFLGNTLYSK